MLEPLGMAGGTSAGAWLPALLLARGAHSQLVSRKQARAPARSGFGGNPRHQVARATSAWSGLLLVEADVCSLNAIRLYQRLCNEHDYEGSVPERSGEKEEVREEEVAAAAGVLAGVPEAEEGSDVDLDFDLETECTHGKKVKNALHLRSCRAHSTVSVSCFLRQGKAPELNLQHRGLGAQGPKALASALTSNPYVRQLNLRDNGLCGTGAEALAGGRG
ncbi:hypothetical protein MC885_009718 [Smutsia gigantea]|nr:hypothetical protein MC885_009718 [Smutsia gigantea]